MNIVLFQLANLLLVSYLLVAKCLDSFQVSYMSLYVLFSVMWKSDLEQIHSLIPGNDCVK